MSATDASIAWIVQRGKTQLARFVTRYADGVLVGVDDGAADADVTFTVAPAVADQLRDGVLDPSVGFMRGELKMSGDFGALLAVLPVTRDSEHRAALARAFASVL
jgi:hypothetical protein